ncbi:MAG: glutamine amidotransferase-related protein [Desulfomonilia bacterium]
MEKDPVIDYLPDQRLITKKGGTIRPGAYGYALSKGANAMTAYQSNEISERQRHCYEFNNAYQQQLAEKGLIISGRNPETGFVEIIELPDHPWFVGPQFHPEFKSKPMQPHPLFRDFIKTGCTCRDSRTGQGRNAQCLIERKGTGAVESLRRACHPGWGLFPQSITCTEQQKL